MTMTLERGPSPVHRLGVRLDPDHLTDGQLLGRYVGERDEVAFAVLVRRHAGLVYGVCRRVLRNGADADDAFQAAFLVLHRKADSLTERATVGDWLYAVAVRVAMKARGLTAKRHRKEATAARPETAPPDAGESLDWFDRELAALPVRYREPVLLCLIQEQPREAAATALGIPEGTLASRLAYAKKWLAGRLTRRGITAPLALAAAVPAALLDSASAQAFRSAVPDVVNRLATGAIRAMFVAKLRVGVLAVAAGLLLAGGGVMLAAPEQPAKQPEKKAPAEPEWMKAFRKEYRLKDGEYVKRVPAPFIAERTDFLLDHFRKRWANEQVDEKNEGAIEWMLMGVLFLEDDGKAVTYKTMASTEATGFRRPPMKIKPKRIKLTHVVEYATGRTTPEVVYDERAKGQDVFLEDDLVIRKGAPLDKLLPDLQKVIGECELDVYKTPPVLTLKEEEQEVYVMGGKFEIKPREWRGKDEIDVYADEAVVSKEYNHKTHEYDRTQFGVVWYQSTPATFAGTLGAFVNRRVVWDAELPAAPRFNTYLHARNPNRVGKEEQAADRDPEKVLKNVSEQTGLSFQKEKRKVPVLYVSVPEKK